MKWIMFTSIVFLLGSKVMATPQYSLKLLENSHFRDWTFRELEEKILLHPELIQKNICNGSEFELFPIALKVNFNKNSLKIQSASSADIYTYIDGFLYQADGSQIKESSIKDSYVKDIIGLMKVIRSLPEGKILLDQLQSSLYPITIIKDDNPRFEAIGSNAKANYGMDEASALQHFVTLRRTSQNVPLAQFGSGGKIHFNPQKKLTSIESDEQERELPPYITLAHEMYHAYDAVRGLLDVRFVIHEKMEMTQVSEYRATYFESTIRKRLGLKLRKYYSKSGHKTQSLLDDSGAPYQIPAPCLNLSN